jgi:hypothetical protein
MQHRPIRVRQNEWLPFVACPNCRVDVFPSRDREGRGRDGPADRRYGCPECDHVASRRSFAAGHSIVRHQFLAAIHGAEFPGPDEKALADDARHRGWHTRRLMVSDERQYGIRKCWIGLRLDSLCDARPVGEAVVGSCAPRAFTGTCYWVDNRGDQRRNWGFHTSRRSLSPGPRPFQRRSYPGTGTVVHGVNNCACGGLGSWRSFSSRKYYLVRTRRHSLVAGHVGRNSGP